MADSIKTPAAPSASASAAGAVAGLDSDPFVAAYPELREFWMAAEKGSFLLKTCTTCQQAHWYPRMICPFCSSQAVEWRPSEGEGSVYSFTVMRRAEPPYVLAYVKLDEKPMLMTNIVGCDVDAVHIGQRVKVQFRAAAEGRQVPFFTPR